MRRLPILAIVNTALLALMLAAVPTTAQAGVVVQYDLGVSATVAQDPADVVWPNVTAGNFQAFLNGSLSTDLSNSGAGISSTYNDAFMDRSRTGTTITASTDEYFTFTVTPDAGYETTFNNIAFDYVFHQGSSITYTYELRSSADSFSSVLGTATNVGGPFDLSQDIDLSTLGAQSSPVEFRFLFADTNNGVGYAQHVDNVVLNGTTSSTDVVTSLIDPSTLSARASSSYPTGNRDPSKAVNGAGMMEDSLGTYHDATSNGTNVNWMSDTDDTTGWFEVDLGQQYLLGNVKVWNFTSTNRAIRETKEVDVYVSTVANPTSGNYATNPDWTLVMSNLVFSQIPNGDNRSPELLDFGPSGETARWVALDILDDFGDRYTGLGELRFFQLVPEPTTLLIWSMLAGLGVGLGWRRRK